jgi:hypothetical protein
MSSSIRARATKPARRVTSGVIIGVSAVGATTVVVALLIGSLSSINPFATHTTEHPSSVVLAQMHDLSTYEAATGRFQTLVDQDRTSSVLPEWASGEHVVLSAEGDVEATVDMTHAAESMQLSADGKSATVHLPAPQLTQPRLDPSSTRIIDRDTGLLDRVGNAVTDSSSDDAPLYQSASNKLEAAAAQSNLADVAKANTEKYVTDMLQKSGVEHVTVVFDAPGPKGAA